jgi:predicted RNase H-like HicB family nuclease
MTYSAEEAASMSNTLRFTALVWQEGDEFVSLGPEADVASFGATIDEALARLREALEVHFSGADDLRELL